MHDLETRSCISSQLKQFYLEGVSDAVQAGEGDWFILWLGHQFVDCIVMATCRELGCATHQNEKAVWSSSLVVFSHAVYVA